MLYPGSDIDVAHYGLLLGRFEVVYESINDDVLHESSGQHKHFVTITGFHSVNIPMLEILRYQGKQLLQQNTEVLPVKSIKLFHPPYNLKNKILKLFSENIPKTQSAMFW